MPMTLATLLTSMTLSVHLDTTVVVKPGTRLDIDNFGGSIAITSWSKNAVKLEADYSSRSVVEVENVEGALTVRTSGRMGPPRATDYAITVPKWMAVKLSGVYTDMTVEGTENDVRATTVKGDVEVKGGKGYIALSSVQGSVKATGARGHIELHSVNEAIEATDLDGDLTAETVNGDIVLEKVSSNDVDAATVNGDVCFGGPIGAGGHYRFATHNGDLQVVLPDSPNATISVATFSGDFESSFPVKLTETKRGKRFNFTLGTGKAELELESFEGTVRLVRNSEKGEKGGCK